MQTHTPIAKSFLLDRCAIRYRRILLKKMSIPMNGSEQAKLGVGFG